MDPHEMAENLFPADAAEDAAPAPPTVEETLVDVPGAQLHLVDPDRSLDLGAGTLSIVRLRQGDHCVAVLARLTVAGKGQEQVLEELDRVLKEYTTFSVKQVDEEAGGKSEVMDTRAVSEITPEEAAGDKKEEIEEQSAAFWTTIAPNVDDYSSSVARLIAKGSGQLVRGIIWCGDITATGLKCGEAVLKKGAGANGKHTQVKPSSLKRMKRARRVTKMSNKVANSILSGVLKVSGFVTSTVVNSKPAQKFFKLMPGEVILASLDGFGKVWDAVEVSGKNVMKTSSVVTTSVVTHRYGDQAGEITQDYLHATGNALGVAWAVFKIRKALDPKGHIKKSSLASSAAHAVAKQSISLQKKK
ncbi:unnamed protein product [Triticum turgidum subsp. durum]|uniref:Senescence domain-containing protein n=1 Tax=Triticum turgidum subsp. durum TaxID=4567 RepID=A0A9R0S5H9_TRITD|nr:unnamed protein product [Triticum turgidum subsp. durum]